MKVLGTTLVILMLASGAGLLAYARWTRAIAEADTALAAGRLEEAVSAYERAETRFELTPAAKQLFNRDYARAAGNRLWALYRLKKYDETIEAAERAPLEASPHFWSGCAFFEKGRAEAQPEARLGWFSRAEDEFRKAVDANPGDWDTKFNFELTSRLAAGLRRQPKTPPSQMMQLLRPPTSGTRTPRKVG